MKCPKCFKENSSGVKFCAFCGAVMQQSNVGNSGFTSAGGSRPGNKTVISPVTPAVNRGYSMNELIIGRDSGNDVSINDASISGKHAKIFLESGTVYIEDLRSLNGTFVNGNRVQGRAKVKSSDQISLGTHILNTNTNQLAGLFSRSSDGNIFQDGSLRLTFNSTWVGKIIYFILVILLLLPWITVSSKDGQFSFTALDFAMNSLPAGISAKSLNFPGYGSAHTIFLILFILTVIGLFVNFIKLPITEKLNVVNLLSLVILILVIVIAATAESSISFDNAMLNLLIDKINFRLAFPAYIFLLLCFISLFEGVIEYYISNNK